MKLLEVSRLDLANELQRLATGVNEPPRNPIGFSKPRIQPTVIPDDIAESIGEYFTEFCTPPVPLYLVPLAIEAITSVVRAEGKTIIPLPLDVVYKNEVSVSASVIVESLNLGGYVEEILE